MPGVDFFKQNPGMATVIVLLVALGGGGVASPFLASNGHAIAAMRAELGQEIKTSEDKIDAMAVTLATQTALIDGLKEKVAGLEAKTEDRWTAAQQAGYATRVSEMIGELRAWVRNLEDRLNRELRDP